MWEIREIKPLVIEYRRDRIVCEKCKESISAALAETLGTTTARPKLLGTAAIFLGRLRGSRRLRGYPRTSVT